VLELDHDPRHYEPFLASSLSMSYLSKPTIQLLPILITPSVMLQLEERFQIRIRDRKAVFWVLPPRRVEIRTGR
jgi:hypothetical protein